MFFIQLCLKRLVWRLFVRFGFESGFGGGIQNFKQTKLNRKQTSQDSRQNETKKLNEADWKEAEINLFVELPAAAN